MALRGCWWLVLGIAALLLPLGVVRAEELLDWIPPDASAVVMTDWSPDSESVQVLSETEELQPGSRELLRTAAEKILRGLGINLSLSEDLWQTIGPRVVKVFYAPEPGQSMPEVMVLAEIRDARRLERTLQRSIGAFLRTAAVERVERGDSVYTLWRGPDGRPIYSYLIRQGHILVAAFGSRLTARVLSATAPPAPGRLRAYLESAPPGLLRYAVLQSAFEPRRPRSEGGVAGSIAFTRQGVLLNAVGEIDDERVKSVMEAASALPSLGTDALRPVPDGSLVALSLGRPSDLLDAAQKVLGPGNPLEGLRMLLPNLTGLLEGELAISLRAPLPQPSWLVSLAAKDAETLRNQIPSLQNLLSTLGLGSLKESRFGEHTLYFLQGPDQKVAGPIVLTTTGRYLLAAADRRTLEEALEVLAGEEDSLVDTETFQSLREVHGEEAKLLLYADPSALVGAGMILAQAFWFASPFGVRLAEALQGFHSLSVSAAVQGQRLQVKALVGLQDGRLPPGSLAAVAGAAVAGAAVLLPSIARSREAARTAACEANMKQLAAALRQYEADHGRLPSAGGWREELKPYVKDQSVFHCPADTLPHPSSYALNRNLGGKATSRRARQDETVLLFESTAPGENPSGTGQALPSPGRHGGQNHFAFVDGSVALKPGVEPAQWTLGPLPPPARPAVQAPRQRPAVRQPRGKGGTTRPSVNRAPRPRTRPRPR